MKLLMLRKKIERKVKEVDERLQAFKKKLLETRVNRDYSKDPSNDEKNLKKNGRST